MHSELGNAAVGAPPMSVPHLDTRWINKERSLLFGPFAGFSSNFLKYGSKWDWFKSIKSTNIFSMFQAGIENLDLGQYLLNQLRQTDEDRIETLKRFVPSKPMKYFVSKLFRQALLVRL